MRIEALDWSEVEFQISEFLLRVNHQPIYKRMKSEFQLGMQLLAVSVGGRNGQKKQSN